MKPFKCLRCFAVNGRIALVRKSLLLRVLKEPVRSLKTEALKVQITL